MLELRKSSGDPLMENQLGKEREKQKCNFGLSSEISVISFYKTE